MSGITTHILDTARGRPASDVTVRLERRSHGAWASVSQGVTDSDGRCKTLTDGAIDAGVYRLVFETRAYFDDLGKRSFYPEVSVAFEVVDAAEHYHVPLLLNPFGYSTYRGS